MDRTDSRTPNPVPHERLPATDGAAPPPRPLTVRSPRVVTPTTGLPRRLPAGLAALAAAWCLGGCALGVAPARPRADAEPPPAPPRWAAAASPATGAAAAVALDAPAAGPAALATWWRRFGDPTLDTLMLQALAHSTDLASARAVLRQARASRDAVAADGQPRLAASVSGQASRSGGDGSQLHQAGLDASWELDLFGAQRSARAAADATVQARVADLDQARVSLAAELVLAYLDLRSAQGRLELARQSLQSLQRTRQLTDWRVQAGLDSPLSLDQARAAEAQAAASLPALQTAERQAVHALSLLTGQPPAALQPVLAAVAPLPQAPAALALALPADTLRQRADLRAAEASVRAARASLAQAEAGRSPTLTLGGSLGVSALRLSGLGGAPVAGSLLAQAAATLFDGGAVRAAIDGQDAALERAEIAWRAAVLAALKEVEDALVNLQGQQARQAALREAVASARRAAATAEQRYASGLIAYASVLDTQRTLISQRDSLALTDAALLAAHVQLYKALGGGWQPEAAGG